MTNAKPPKHSAQFRIISLQGIIAGLATVTIAASLTLRALGYGHVTAAYPLFVAYVLGGTPLVIGLARRAWHGEFGSDLLAGISIITAIVLDEYLAGVFVILMLSGGQAIEEYALRRASSVLDALARRMPSKTRRRENGLAKVIDIREIHIGDTLEILPHDICPVDGEVVEGHGSMDESYLTGEPYQMPKAPGSTVLSGAINAQTLMVIKATALPVDSRYQKIAQVIETQASKQVPMRRLGDTLGAWYTPLALIIAAGAWLVTGEALRFLAVLVVATPCPLLIAIPVAIIGAISNAARRGIIIKNPAALERAPKCRTMILDKTGTLTYGVPAITSIECSSGFDEFEVLRFLAAIERYSKHPLAEAVQRTATEHGLALPEVLSVSEPPGQGLQGVCEGRSLRVTGRKVAVKLGLTLPPQQEGLECVVLIDDQLAAVIHFRDTPRQESKAFVDHLAHFHQISKVMIMSGDRDAEVRHLAQIVGISEVQGGLEPEQKLTRVIAETKSAPTIYIGDGINDAPSLQAATVGIALGTKSDITSEAADVVIMDPSLKRVDEFMHLSARMRHIALQSAIGGMGLSVLGMAGAACGLVTPLAGAILQEAIDVVAVMNALRASGSGTVPRHQLVDTKSTQQNI